MDHSDDHGIKVFIEQLLDEVTKTYDKQNDFNEKLVESATSDFNSANIPQDIKSNPSINKASKGDPIEAKHVCQSQAIEPTKFQLDESTKWSAEYISIKPNLKYISDTMQTNVTPQTQSQSVIGLEKQTIIESTKESASIEDLPNKPTSTQIHQPNASTSQLPEKPVHAPLPSATDLQNQLIQRRRLQQQQQQAQTKSDDANLTMYKALAIKLKKELVKTKEDLENLTASNEKKISELQNKINQLQEDDRVNITRVASAEVQLRSLRQQLQSAETDLKCIQLEYDQYKLKASQMLQKNNASLYSDSHHNRSFDAEKYNQLKELFEDQKKRVSRLEDQLARVMLLNESLETENAKMHDLLKAIDAKNLEIKELEDKITELEFENENLNKALIQLRQRLKDPQQKVLPVHNLNIIEIKALSKHHRSSSLKDGESSNSDKYARKSGKKGIPTVQSESGITTRFVIPDNHQDVNENIDENNLDDNDPVKFKAVQTTQSGDQNVNAAGSPGVNSSNSSENSGSSNGFVHIKPNTFEIISRSSVLEDAQNQIDNLTKAYLDSESTNALLSDQVRALKDEIRRMQRRAERVELAENLEYLKNVVFKFLSLDSSQVEQRQRLIPVLSTILKLSPDESSKLSSLTIPDKRQSLASSFFKL